MICCTLRYLFVVLLRVTLSDLRLWSIVWHRMRSNLHEHTHRSPCKQPTVGCEPEAESAAAKLIPTPHLPPPGFLVLSFLSCCLLPCGSPDMCLDLCLNVHTPVH